MKKRYFFFSSASGAVVDRPFIIQINSGADSTFTIPTTGGGYDYNVETSDGQSFTGVTGNLTINFPDANTLYDVSISGDFPRIYFNYGSERLKIKDIKQWGDIAWGAVQFSAFYGCEDMVCSALDSPDLGALTNGEFMFCLASSFNPSNFAPTLENLVSGSFMFYDAINFAQDIYAPNSVNLENDNSMFLNTKIEKITLNNSSLTFTDANSFACSQLTDLILIDRKIDLWIDKAPLLTGTKIDALANSVADLTGQPLATVTMTQVQYNSCDTTIWTNKNWTIAIAEMLTLSVNDTPQANLRIDTHSGLPYHVDWGDGVFEPYLSGQEATKVYTTNFTGDIKVVAPMGLEDISRFESNNNSTAWDFNLGVVVPLTGLDIFWLQNLPNANIIGSINSFISATGLSVLRLYNLPNTSISGDSNAFVNMTNLREFLLLTSATYNITMNYDDILNIWQSSVYIIHWDSGISASKATTSPFNFDSITSSELRFQGIGLSTQSMDNMIIALDDSLIAQTNPKIIYLNNNAPHSGSPAVTTALSNLASKNITVVL